MHQRGAENGEEDGGVQAGPSKAGRAKVTMRPEASSHRHNENEAGFKGVVLYPIGRSAARTVTSRADDNGLAARAGLR
jgi:hypothetical protein